MGAKTWTLAYVDGDAAAILKSQPELDRAACRAALAELFPDTPLTELPDTSLDSTCPPENEIQIACFPGLTILSEESILTESSQLDRRFVAFARGRTILHHVILSSTDCFAYGVWENGELRRSLSLDADHGIAENIGQPLPFELPYWAGEHAEEEPRRNGIPFHPLDLGHAASLALFGYQLEGIVTAEQVDVYSIPMMRFARPAPQRAPQPKAWWKFW